MVNNKNCRRTENEGGREKDERKDERKDLLSDVVSCAPGKRLIMQLNQ